MTIPEILLGIGFMAAIGIDLLLRAAVRRLQADLADRDRSLSRVRAELWRLERDREGNTRTVVVNVTADTSQFRDAIARAAREGLGG